MPPNFCEAAGSLKQLSLQPGGKTGSGRMPGRRRNIGNNGNSNMKVRAKKSLGQHFLTDLSIARRIASALVVPATATPAMTETATPATTETATPATTETNTPTTTGTAVKARTDVLEIGPGTGVLTQYLLRRNDISLKMVELDHEAVAYLLTALPETNGRLIEADFLHLRLESLFPGNFLVIGNFPYNISSQIFFRILDCRDRVPQVVCMIQKEVAERIAEPPGTRTYGILSVLLQAWYDIEYLFTVGPGAFNPAPKVTSAVIRLTRNGRASLGCDEFLFKATVKTAFNQRRKTLRNSLKPLIQAKVERDPSATSDLTSDPVFDLRPERLGVEDFIALTLRLS